MTASSQSNPNAAIVETETTAQAYTDASLDHVDTVHSVENVSSSDPSMVDTNELAGPLAGTSADVIAGVKAIEDFRYRKYFKMNQFGVPLEAVKMKMKAEGFDPNILE